MYVRIIGGGIGGLTTAIGLVQRDISVTVHEAATELRPTGSGILLRSNALAALSHLDLAKDVRAVGVDVERLTVIDEHDRLLRQVNLTATVESTRWSAVYLSRPALQDLLLSHLPDDVVQLGNVCARVHPALDSESPTVHFQDRRSGSARVVVGSDGIGSTVRDAIVTGDPRRETDTVTYRGIAAFESPLSNETRQVWGSGTRVGLAPLGDDRTYWFATSNRHLADPEAPAAVLDAISTRYAAFPEPIPSLIDRTPVESLVITELADIAPLARWHLGSTVLLGDAAHATLPYLGQGAGQAIEDAVALSNRLANRPPIQALNAYVDARKRRTEWVVRLSRLWWHLAQLEGIPARIRNRLVRSGPQEIQRWQQRWLSIPRL